MHVRHCLTVPIGSPRSTCVGWVWPLLPSPWPLLPSPWPLLPSQAPEALASMKGRVLPTTCSTSSIVDGRRHCWACTAPHQCHLISVISLAPIAWVCCTAHQPSPCATRLYWLQTPHVPTRCKHPQVGIVSDSSVPWAHAATATATAMPMHTSTPGASYYLFLGTLGKAPAQALLIFICRATLSQLCDIIHLSRDGHLYDCGNPSFLLSEWHYLGNGENQMH